MADDNRNSSNHLSSSPTESRPVDAEHGPPPPPPANNPGLRNHRTISSFRREAFLYNLREQVTPSVLSSNLRDRRRIFGGHTVEGEGIEIRDDHNEEDWVFVDDKKSPSHASRLGREVARKTMGLPRKVVKGVKNPEMSRELIPQTQAPNMGFETAILRAGGRSENIVAKLERSSLAEIDRGSSGGEIEYIKGKHQLRGAWIVPPKDQDAEDQDTKDQDDTKTIVGKPHPSSKRLDFNIPRPIENKKLFEQRWDRIHAEGKALEESRKDSAKTLDLNTDAEDGLREGEDLESQTRTNQIHHDRDSQKKSSVNSMMKPIENIDEEFTKEDTFGQDSPRTKEFYLQSNLSTSSTDSVMKTMLAADGDFSSEDDFTESETNETGATMKPTSGDGGEFSIKEEFAEIDSRANAMDSQSKEVTNVDALKEAFTTSEFEVNEAHLQSKIDTETENKEEISMQEEAERERIEEEIAIRIMEKTEERFNVRVDGDIEGMVEENDDHKFQETAETKFEEEVEEMTEKDHGEKVRTEVKEANDEKVEKVLEEN